MVCRHLDGVRTNNHLWNLAWGTYEENEADKIRHGTRAEGVRHGNAKLTKAQVLGAVASKRGGEKAPSIAARLGISISTVFLIMQGKRYACYTGIRRNF
jgi:phosphoglycolate phosphatase-like HAD superfamily hydrolase